MLKRKVGNIMENEKMKNIVVLKNLPSNIVEEAIIILKSNKYAKKIEAVDRNNKVSSQEIKQKGKDYVVKEAEMLLSNYITKIEDSKISDKTFKKLKNKYKTLRNYSLISTIALLISLIINLI